MASGVLRIRWIGFTVVPQVSDCPPVGVEEGDGGGGGVEGDEGGRQGPSKAPGQKALPRYHLQHPSNVDSIFIAMNLRGLRTST